MIKNTFINPLLFHHLLSNRNPLSRFVLYFFFFLVKDSSLGNNVLESAPSKFRFFFDFIFLTNFWLRKRNALKELVTLLQNADLSIDFKLFELGMLIFKLLQGALLGRGIHDLTLFFRLHSVRHPWLILFAYRFHFPLKKVFPFRNSGGVENQFLGFGAFLVCYGDSRPLEDWLLLFFSSLFFILEFFFSLPFSFEFLVGKQKALFDGVLFDNQLWVLAGVASFLVETSLEGWRATLWLLDKGVGEPLLLLEDHGAIPHSSLAAELLFCVLLLDHHLSLALVAIFVAEVVLRLFFEL